MNRYSTIAERVAAVNGYLQFGDTTCFYHQIIGETELSEFMTVAKNYEEEFLRELRLASEQVTSFAVKPNDIKHVYTSVESYHNSPSILVAAHTAALNEEQRERVIGMLQRKYHIIR